MKNNIKKQIEGNNSIYAKNQIKMMLKKFG